MIYLQRELKVKLRESADLEKRPREMSVGKYYPVVGYQSGMRKSQDEKPDREEIRVVYVVNEKGYLQAVYPSLCMFYVDQKREDNSGSH